MKRFVYILLLLLPSLAFADTYYIGPSGDDGTGDGSRGNPWFEIEYATDQCSTGDSVIALTGIYYYDNRQDIDVSGTHGDYFVIMSEAEHPDSVIFDFSTYPQSVIDEEQLYGIVLTSDSCVKYVGLTVKNHFNIDPDNGRAHGWFINNGNHVIYDFCVADSIAGRGFHSNNTNDIFHYNCDVTWCADPQTSDPGNAGTGFLPGGVVNESMEDTILFRGCRAWYCADQGFAGAPEFYTIYDSCWSFSNGLHDEGYTSGSQIGFKPGYTVRDVDTLAIYIKNCIMAFNGSYGLHENTGSTGYKYNMSVYNSIFYENGISGIITGEYDYNLDNINRYRNNISFDNGGGSPRDFWIQDSADHYYNSWDYPYYPAGLTGTYFVSPATVNTDDFLDLPTDVDDCVTVLAATRKAGGYLPDIGGYFKLASTSDLIDQGIDVGLPYVSSFPDLGAFEFSPAVEKDFILIDTSLQLATVGDTFQLFVENDSLYVIAWDTGEKKCWSKYKSSGTDNASAHYYRYTYDITLAPSGVQISQLSTNNIDSAKVVSNEWVWYNGGDAYPMTHRTVCPLGISWLLLGLFLNRKKKYARTNKNA